MSEWPDLYLAAHSLFSKFGFGDGGAVLDWLYAAEDRGCDVTGLWPFDWHEVLCQLVAEHLLPEVPGEFTTHRIATSHNPIRIETWRGDEWPDRYVDEPEEVKDIDVTVPGSAVLKAICEVKRGVAA